MKYVLRKNDPRSRETICSMIQSLNSGRDWSIEVKQHRKKRSNAQLAYFYAGIVNPICEETGNEQQDIHDWLCMTYFGSEEYRVMGQLRKRAIRTLTSPEPLTVEQMVNFSEWCVARMAQEGIVLEPPREIEL